MTPASDVPGARAPAWHARAAWVVAGVCAAALGGWSLLDHGSRAAAVDGPTAGSAATLSWPLALIVLAAVLLVTALAFALGAALAHARAAEPLREARAARQALGDLCDLWQWESDAQHRLSHLQPPALEAGATGDSGTVPLGLPLWSGLGFAPSPTAVSLSQRMVARQRFDQVSAWRLAGDQLCRWQLRGAPRFDAAGAFLGYFGTARVTDSTNDAALSSALLEASDTAEGSVAMVLSLELPDGRRRLAHASHAARALSTSSDSRWDGWLAGVPPSLRAAVEQAAGAVELAGEGNAEAQAAEWRVQVQRRRVPGVDDGTLSILRITRTATATAAVSAAAGPDDPRGDLRGDLEAFTYTVSHDLRAPIRVVEGFTRIVKEDYGRALDRIGLDHLDRVLSAAARMNSMIDALLALSRLSSQPLAQQPVNLSQLAGYVIDDLRRGSPQRAVSVEIQPGLSATGDPTLLRVVLENLLGNAWKYTARQAQPSLSMSMSLQGERRVYTVRDNGAGFDMRFADRLFGVFQRLHSASDFQGTGVGLASVRRIVHRHGGEIWAESEVDQGASFHFTLSA